MKQSNRQAWPLKGAAILIVAVALSDCDKIDMPKFNFGKKKQIGATAPVQNQTTTKLIERDVEAPDVFQVTDNALWDGRPSLGGVWVAYPGKVDPERVIIRNKDNGTFVIGALFKRERESVGPKIQLSSEAADALGVLAGKPVKLNVTALRREAVPEKATPPKAKPKAKKDVTAIASAALDRAASDKKTQTKKTEATSKITIKPVAKTRAGKKTATGPVKMPTAKPVSKHVAKPISSLHKPFIQIGIFSVEQNARNTATSLSTQSILPIVKAQQSQGKKFWRVLVGPASDKAERAMLLKKARELGFNDAYFVTN